ncbi:MAG: mechanosensitive ion channel [Clostridia bacterium]|nr:mechanosensitive ion channel [Clostridia bacterium]
MNFLLSVDIEFAQLLTNIGNWLVTEGLKIVLALVIFAIYCAIIKAICKKLDKKLQKKNVDLTLRKVSIPWLKRILILLGFVCVLTYLGIETSAIAAAITSIGLTIGLALQGSLANFAGGVIIVVMRPYKIGDFIECDGQSGTVEDIKLFYTYLRTSDNKVIVIPNGVAGNSVVTNYNIKDTRRNDILFSISYDCDFEKAKSLIKECMDKNELILQDPAPFINIKEHADNAIVILARYFTKSDDFWAAHWYMMEAVKKTFDENGITIPYPQLDVHIKKDDDIDEAEIAQKVAQQKNKQKKKDK